MILTEYDDLMEMMDKVRLAHRYNESHITFNREQMRVKEAERIIDKTLKGGVHGNKYG